MTKQKLLAMWDQFKTQEVQPYSDGNYGIVISVKDFIDIEEEIGYVNILRPLNPPKCPVSNTCYKGIMLGFHTWTLRE